MPNLFENATQALRLGVEDYEVAQEKPARALSAVRNFYAGLLLLAKEVLVRQAPNADENEVIGANYKPVPDGAGGVKYEPQSKRTIDLDTIARRFADFKLEIDQKKLKELSAIRNDVEHHYSKKPSESVRQAIAKAFPVAAQLFRLAGEKPHEIIGEAWETMLEVHEVYEQEREACHSTFDKIEWCSLLLEDAPRKCPECRSDLVAQENPENKVQEDIRAHCRFCKANINADMLVKNALIEHFEWESYVAMTDGDTAPLQRCPECGLAAYVLSEELAGCPWCGFVLDGSCAYCATDLMPDNVDTKNYYQCSYCAYLLAKDD